jgi:hypothetical protein
MQAFAATCLFAAVSAVTDGNPFTGKTMYVNPSYQKELDGTIATTTGAVKSTL